MQADHFKQSFNSKLVRLEEKHKHHVRLPDAEFQFQTGSIKSSLSFSDRLNICAFQFQTGSIKRVSGVATQFRSKDGFNSKLVRLKETL